MEGFISKIFRKSYSEILLSDVEEFFKVPQEETGVLEFKSGEVSLEDVFKEVAAFLNTEGRLIIIGAPKKQEEKINVTQIKEVYQGNSELLIGQRDFSISEEESTKNLGS
jgi:hypothetical protein